MLALCQGINLIPHLHGVTMVTILTLRGPLTLDLRVKKIQKNIFWVPLVQGINLIPHLPLVVRE